MKHLSLGCASVVASTCLLSVSACAGGNRAPARPHILLISLDALRADHLSSYGYRRLTSPFLDRLAAEGLRFSHAFANTHGTPPSHATLFTSLYQETHRVSFRREGETKRNDVVPDSLRLLPEILKEEGYRTVGVTGAGYVSETFGFAQGFDSFHAQPQEIGAAADLFLEQVRDSLTSDQPIFAFFHTYEIHSPYEPPERYRRLFGEHRSSFASTNENLVPLQERARDVSEDDLLALEASYDGEIRYTDDELRRLFDRLREIGFLDQAFVVVLSDHGEEFGEHGGLLHRVTLHDELIHVPLILWGSQVPDRIVDPHLVSLIDVAPTILFAAGIAPPPSMEGRNLLVEAREASTENEAVFSQYTNLLYCIRTHRWKLIEDRRSQRLHLYDLRLDPGELSNLAEYRPEVTAELAARLERWRESVPVLDQLDSPLPDLDEAEVERLRTLGYLD